jgi:deoxyribodipyrimidine photo-lyase
MSKTIKNQYRISIFIFTRDLRLYDNTSLICALSKSITVLPIFILNPEQLSDKNKYKSNNCVQFMCESLYDLQFQLTTCNSRLFLFSGDPIEVIQNLFKQSENIDAVFINKDYTPFAKKREENIRKLCKLKEKVFEVYEDYMLTGIDEVINGSKKPYVKFTPYANTAKKSAVKKPVKNGYKNYILKSVKMKDEFSINNLKKLYEKNKDIWVSGGRENGKKMLSKISQYKKYDISRDYPFESTTNLSAYLKFNVVSVREVYWKIKESLGQKTKLLTQLYWRDFYMNIIYHQKVINTNMNGHKVKWKSNRSDFNKWKEGKTGFPLVDAGMRQLNQTGYMHNRARMVVGSFLVKIMHMDWQKGEQYFASKLVDYDPANNNGGWQWVSGTGTDSQPYFRYLNPWTQSEKYDKDVKYIKNWVSELKDVPASDIHKWTDSYKKYNIKYPKPMYDNVTERVKKAILMYK